LNSDDTNGKGCPLDPRITRFHAAAHLASAAMRREDAELRAQYPDATERELMMLKVERNTPRRVFKAAFTQQAGPEPRREH